MLIKYNWPGNIRELRNVIDRAMLFCDEPEIDLPPSTDLYAPEVYATGRENFRRLIAQGGVSIDGSRISDAKLDLGPGAYLFKVGKKLVRWNIDGRLHESRIHSSGFLAKGRRYAGAAAGSAGRAA
mgnify:CR=1 FL=1